MQCSDMRLQNIKLEYQIIVLIFSSLLVQLLARYYSSVFVVGYFNLLSLILRFGLPVAAWLFIFKFPAKDMGLRWPTMRKADWIFLLSILVGAPLLMRLTLVDTGYFDYYSDSFANTQADLFVRLKYFFEFTVSTLFGWEFLHRSYLLFGLFLLFRRANLSLSLSQTIAVCITSSFEVLYHFLKPDLEAWGMMMFSPLLCILAFRTKSLLPALGIHLYIECMFIYYALSL